MKPTAVGKKTGCTTTTTTHVWTPTAALRRAPRQRYHGRATAGRAGPPSFRPYDSALSGSVPTIYGLPPTGPFIAPKGFPSAHPMGSSFSAKRTTKDASWARHSESRVFPWRRFVKVNEGGPAEETVSSKPKQSEGKLEFSLMTYNVLAQAYWAEEYSASCPPFASMAMYRADNIVREIEYCRPDIVCMQEVDCYDNFYKEKLYAMGYASLFKRRQGRPDGSALFFLAHKFTLEDVKELNLNDIVHSSHPTVQIDPYRFLRDNVAVVSLLRSTENVDQLVCIATGHAFWNPHFEDVKLMQMKTIINAAENFKKEAERRTDSHVPLIIAGDFNSLPESAVVQFVKEGRLRDDNPKREEYCFTDEHALRLASAYDALGNPNTNFTTKFTGCLDWIFYSTQALVVTEVLERFDEENPLFVEYNRALPNPWLSSDHIAIMAKFVLHPATLEGNACAS